MMQISIIFSKNEVLSTTIFKMLPKHYKTIVIDISIYSCKAKTFDSIQITLNMRQWCYFMMEQS